jgi:hypothetical protein
MRALVLAIALAPFVLWAGRDAIYHVRDRKPGALENLTHLLLGASQLVTIVGAFRGDVARLALGAGLVAIFGAVDEFAFHRGLSARESDLHAKAHLGLFAFVAVAFALVTFPDLASLTRAAQAGATP